LLKEKNIEDVSVPRGRGIQYPDFDPLEFLDMIMYAL
jgi:hypothetical protein